MNNQLQTVLDFKTNNLTIAIIDLKLAIALILVTAIASVNISLVNAQTDDVQADYLEDIQAGKNSEWQFSGTTESVSIEDDISTLEEYRIQNSDVSDIQLTEGSRRGTNNSIQDYSIKTDIFNY